MMMFSSYRYLNLEDNFDYFDDSDMVLIIISVLILSLSITGRNIGDDL